MPLQQLADQIVAIHDRGQSTPVLVTPSYLSFRPAFYVALAAQLTLHPVINRRRRPIRFDWYRDLPGAWSLLGHRSATAKVIRVNQLLARHLQPVDVTATMRTTVAIGLPVEHKLIVGISSEQDELPGWTTAVRFATTLAVTEPASPEPAFDLQSVGQVAAA